MGLFPPNNAGPTSCHAAGHVHIHYRIMMRGLFDTHDYTDTHTKGSYRLASAQMKPECLVDVSYLRWQHAVDVHSSDTTHMKRHSYTFL